MIELKNISKTFETKDGKVEALKDIAIKINDGDIYGIIGMSGAGKSTLVRCINLLEVPTSGAVLVDGQDLTKFTPKELRAARKRITMIFQSFNLLMQKTCLQNICFPLLTSRVKRKVAIKRGRELLKLVGLADKENAYPAQLSGGQKQRIAIARALATDPKVLLCDEATSALDPKTTNQILDLLSKINRELGITVVIITHQMSVVERICNKVTILDNGRIAESGSVTEIFAKPESEAGKRLVFPDKAEQGLATYRDDRSVISVSFNDSETTESPLIADLAITLGIPASILYASTRSLNGKAFGKMLLGVKKEGDNVDRVLEFLNEHDGVLAELEDVSKLRMEVASDERFN